MSSLLSRIPVLNRRVGLPARMLARQPEPSIQHNFHIMRDQRIVYASIPRVACTMLKTTFARLCTRDPNFPRRSIHNTDIQPMEHISDVGVPKLAAWIESGELRPIAFVRNPYVRVLSCYLSQFGYPLRGWDKPSRIALRGLLVADPMRPATFPEFVEAVSRQTVYQMNGHWRPQADQILWGDIPYAFVGRLETFGEDIVRLGTLIGEDLMPYLGEHVHQTESSERLRQYYTPELQRQVYEIYKADFDAFGYPEQLPV